MILKNMEVLKKLKKMENLRVEGKDYLVKDGDVLFFRVNP